MTVATAAPASILVLANSSLFREIAAFIPGVPHFVLAFKELEYRKHLAATTKSSSGRNAPQEQARAQGALRPEQDPSLPIQSPYAIQRFAGLCAHTLTKCRCGASDWIDENFPGEHEDSDNSPSCHRQITDKQFEELAVKLEDLKIADWIRDHGYVFPASMMDAAAGAGNLELARFSHEYGTEGCTTKAMDSAAGHGHLAIVQFLHRNRNEGCTVQAKTQALQYGHLHVLRFLHENRKSDSYSPMAAMLGAMKGRLECVKFAHDHGFTDFANSVMSYAMLWGHVDVVRFPHENRPQEGCTLDALMAAERLDHHGVVDFLCRNWPVTKPVPAFWEAVEQGQLRLAAKLLLHSSVAWFTASERYKYPQTYSSKGPSVKGLRKPDVLAPGSTIRWSCYTGDANYCVKSGTSMATPHVSGMVALYLARYPVPAVTKIVSTTDPSLNAPYADIAKMVRATALTSVLTTATEYTCGGTADFVFPNNQFGFGRLDAMKMLAVVPSYFTTTTTTTTAPVPTTTAPATTTTPPATTAPATAAPATTAPATSTCVLQVGVDYTGNDIGSATSTTASGCCSICAARTGCKAFTWSTYIGGTCWLKSAKTYTSANSAVTSGTI